MMLRVCSLLCIGLASLSPLQAAQAQRVQAVPLADSVAIGERFLLVLTVERNIMREPLFPTPGVDDSLFGDVSVISEVHRSTRFLGPARPGVALDSVVYEVAAFAVDTAIIPPLPVRFPTGEVDTLTAASAPVVLPIISTVPADAEDIRDLAPLALFERPLWPWVLLALALIGLLVLLILRARQRPEDEAPPPVVEAPGPSPYEAAQARLRALENADLAPPAPLKPFFVELSDALRTYLEDRVRVPALERTTRELLWELRPLVDRGLVSHDAVQLLGETLHSADLVKFADAKPSEASCREALRNAHLVLEWVEGARRAQQAPAPALTPDAS
ncbi:MAG: hypothetical protein AAF970_10230 [Bacteroidota bacterium]